MTGQLVGVEVEAKYFGNNLRGFHAPPSMGPIAVNEQKPSKVPIPFLPGLFFLFGCLLATTKGKTSSECVLHVAGILLLSSFTIHCRP